MVDGGAATFHWESGLSYARSWMEAAFKKVGETAYRNTFAIQHALNYSTLQRVKFPHSDIAKGAITLIRTEAAHVLGLYGIEIRKGVRAVMKRGAAESFSLFEPKYVHGQIATRQVAPHTRVMGNYFFGRGDDCRQVMFMGDGEQEFIVIPDGIEYEIIGFKRGFKP